MPARARSRLPASGRSRPSGRPATATCSIRPCPIRTSERASARPTQTEPRANASDRAPWTGISCVDARRGRVDPGDGVAGGRDDPDRRRRGEDASRPELARVERNRGRHAAGVRVDPGDGRVELVLHPHRAVADGHAVRQAADAGLARDGVRLRVDPQQPVAEDVDRPDRAEAGRQPDHGSARLDAGDDRAASRRRAGRRRPGRARPRRRRRPSSGSKASRPRRWSRRPAASGRRSATQTAAGASERRREEQQSNRSGHCRYLLSRGCANTATVRRRAEMPLKERQTASK